MQLFRSIRWRLTASYLLVVLATIISLGFYFVEHTERRYVSDLQARLRSEARTIGTVADRTPQNDLEAVIKQLAASLNLRITIVDTGGKVLADSHHNPNTMPSHADRPEIAQARNSGSGYSIRRSDTLGTDMLYVAVQHGVGKGNMVRVAEPLSQLDAAKRSIWATFGAAALIALIIAGAISLRLSDDIVGPIAGMTRVARRIAQGDFGLKIGSPSGAKDEVTELGITLNQLAAELRRAVRELREDKKKMQTVFDKTDDGLLILDEQGRIKTINPAACEMLNISVQEARDRTIIEATLNHEFAGLVDRVIRTCRPATLELTFPGPTERQIQTYATALDDHGRVDGAIVVMHDVTEARKVDTMRKDFVANVGHELRTPLASIRAMAETIELHGAHNPGMAREFAESIVKETERVVRLADDLLEIGMIEAQRRPIREEAIAVAEVVGDAVAKLGPAAARKEVSLTSDIEPDLVAQGDKDAVWQILVNLIDNAINYTPIGGQIKVTASPCEDAIAISVSDTGIGIPAADIPRIFERFYRVDKARSRASGGTGLGLSIVRHLVEAHGGRVWAESELDKGSKFTFTLPNQQ